MSREVRRVPLDFDWPLGKVWNGYLMPDDLHLPACEGCDGSGYSPTARHLQERWYGNVPFDPAETGSTPFTADTPAVRERAERNVGQAPDFYGRGEWAIVREARRLAAHFNSSWSHHLHQDDVDALIVADRLRDFTHTFVAGEGWKPIEPAPTVTARQVNEWSLRGFSHDSINCWTVVSAACQRMGAAEECDRCNGRGDLGTTEQRAAYEAWEPTEPPTGDGWQLWETTSEGSPKSPVFADPEDLAVWMSKNPCGFGGRRGYDLDVARRFVLGDGWAPSLAFTPATGLVDGVEFVAGSDGAA